MIRANSRRDNNPKFVFTSSQNFKYMKQKLRELKEKRQFCNWRDFTTPLPVTARTNQLTTTTKIRKNIQKIWTLNQINPIVKYLHRNILCHRQVEMVSEHTSGPQTLFVRKMLTKTTMIYDSISSRMANIKKIKKQTNKCWQGHGATETLIHCLRECKMVPLSQMFWLCLLKLTMPSDPSIPVLCVYPRQMKICIHK